MAIDNKSLSLKVAIREAILNRIEHPKVLDLYCGMTGEMYDRVWNRADEYLGCDKYNPHRKAKTARLSAETTIETIDIEMFNIFDLDCYSSPWAVANRIVEKATGRLGMVLTDGTWRATGGKMNEEMRRELGVGHFSITTLFKRYYHEVSLIMLKALLSHRTLEYGVMAIPPTRRPIYYGMILTAK